MKEQKYLDFIFWSSSGKTEKWNVASKSHGNILGEIKWFGRWRQYCFFPAPNCVFNAGCLTEIEDKVRELNTEFSRQRKRSKDAANRPA